MQIVVLGTYNVVDAVGVYEQGVICDVAGAWMTALYTTVRYGQGAAGYVGTGLADIGPDDAVGDDWDAAGVSHDRLGWGGVAAEGAMIHGQRRAVVVEHRAAGDIRDISGKHAATRRHVTVDVIVHAPTSIGGVAAEGGGGDYGVAGIVIVNGASVVGRRVVVEEALLDLGAAGLCIVHSAAVCGVIEDDRAAIQVRSSGIEVDGPSVEGRIVEELARREYRISIRTADASAGACGGRTVFDPTVPEGGIALVALHGASVDCRAHADQTIHEGRTTLITSDSAASTGGAGADDAIYDGGVRVRVALDGPASTGRSVGAKLHALGACGCRCMARSRWLAASASFAAAYRGCGGRLIRSIMSGMQWTCRT